MHKPVSRLKIFKRGSIIIVYFIILAINKNMLELFMFYVTRQIML